MRTIEALSGTIHVFPTREGNVQLSVTSNFSYCAVLLSPEQCRVLADLLVNSGHGNSWDSLTEVSGVKKSPPKEKDDVVGPV